MQVAVLNKKIKADLYLANLLYYKGGKTKRVNMWSA